MPLPSEGGGRSAASPRRQMYLSEGATAGLDAGRSPICALYNVSMGLHENMLREAADRGTGYSPPPPTSPDYEGLSDREKAEIRTLRSLVRHGPSN